MRQAAHLPVDALVPALHADIREFLAGAAPDDDISILGLEYTGEDLEHYTI